MPRCFLLGRRSWAGHGWLLLHYLSRCGRVGSEGRAQRFARRMIRLVEATGTVWNHQLPKLVFPGSASRQDATEQSWNNLLIFKQAKCQGNVLPLLTYKHTCTTYRGEPLTHKLSTILCGKYLDKIVVCVCVCVCVCVGMFMWFMRTQICIMTWVWHRYYKEKVIYEDIIIWIYGCPHNLKRL